MTPQEYQQQAAECARLAEQTDDPTTKLVSVGLAQAWLQLAKLAETKQRGDGGPETLTRPLPMPDIVPTRGDRP